MSTTFNRQTRRARLCIGRQLTRSGRQRRHTMNRVWLAAYGHDLGRIAERISGRIELPGELVALLSPECLPGVVSPDDRRTLDHAARALLTGDGSRR